MHDCTEQEVAPTEVAPTKQQGFATLTGERRREIASMGGRAAHRAGTAHRFTSEEASRAGHKGGIAVSRDPDYMTNLGRRGGLARGEAMRRRESTAAAIESLYGPQGRGARHE